MQDGGGFSALDFIRSFTGQPRRRQLAQTIVESARQAANADFVQLMLPNSEGRFRIAAVTGNRSPDRQGHLLPLAGSAKSAPAHTVTVRAPERDPVLAGEGIVSALALPVRLESQAAGILLLGWRTPRRLTRAEVRRLERLAEQATLALVHVRALARQQANQANAEASSVTTALLSAVTEPEEVLLRVVEVAVQLAEATRCSIVTNDRGHARLQYSWQGDAWELSNTTIPLEETVTGWVIENRQAYRTSDPTGDRRFNWRHLTPTPPRSLLSVPMFGRDGRVDGVLVLYDRRDSDSFSESQQHLVQGIAQIAAVAIERAELIAELGQSEERYRDLFENANDLITIHGFDERITSVNRACERMTGYSREELLGMKFQDLIVPLHRQRAQENMSRLRAGEQFAPYELGITARDSHVIPVEFDTRLVYKDGQPIAVQSIGRDIGDRKALEEHLVRQAFYDPLTDLANRALFMDRLRHALRAAGRQRGAVTVLFLDLDDFKSINDSLGHGAGDELLVQVARRLLAGLRPGDTLARWGGDEFTILLGELVQPADASPIAERLIEALRVPFLLGGHQRVIGASIGIASSGPGAQLSQPEHLLRAADIALYQAKNAGKGRLVAFEEGMDEPMARFPFLRGG